MPRKPANAPGTYLDLRWDYGDPEEVYVYGHVDPAAFFASVEAYLGGTVDSADFGTFPVFAGPTRQRWARFLYAGSDYDGNPTRIIHEYREAGRGRFRVTAATPEKWRGFTRCDGYAGEHPCWLRSGHTGPHLDHATRYAGRYPAAPCEGCKAPSVTRDSMDVPLCGACFDALPVDQFANAMRQE